MDTTPSLVNGRKKSQESKVPWLNPNLWLSWDKTGHQTFHANCKELLKKKDVSTRQKLKTDEILAEAIYELAMAAMNRNLPRDRVVSEFKRLVVVNPPRFASIMSDILASLDSVSYARSSDGNATARRDIFLLLTRELSSTFYFLFEEKFDSELLPESGLLSAAELKLFNQKFIRLKTKTYYKQQKYNLFREDPEGYAKLIAELSRPLEKATYVYMLNVVRSLIGACYLDPNRVLDIVLEAFECQPITDFFVPLLNSLKPSTTTICEVLALKLNNVESSRSLFNLTALLLQHSIITLDAIYPWLNPDSRVIEKNWERQINEAVDYTSQAMKVRLDGKDTTAPSLLDDDDTLIEDRSTYLDNHKVLLCKALLDIGAWNIASDLLGRHTKYALSSCPLVARSLVRLYNYMLDPIYHTIAEGLDGKRKARRPYHSSGNTKVALQIRDYDDLLESLEVLMALGPYIHCDPVLMYKILRIIRFYLEGVEGKPKTEIYYNFIDVLDEVLLPALCYMDGNCAMAKEIWSVLEYYPYNIRFRLYGAWKSEERARQHPTLMRKRVDLVKQVKQLMRRISKENVKFMGRQLGKLSHSIPSIVFDYILSQVQLFDNLTVPVIDALKYLSPLGYDLLGYCLLEALSPVDPKVKKSSELSVMLTADRPRTKHDGSTIAPWIQSLATFTGTVCKKYSLDLVPILQYIANQLKAKESLDLLILEEIVQKLTGIEAAEDVTSEQLEAMSGGEMLRSEAGYFGQLRTARKSATRLREATSHSDLAITLCILMAQQRNRIIYDESQIEIHTKLVGKLYDQCQDTLVQFGTFLATSCTLDEYTKKIPALRTLIGEYHVDADVAFFLWRPIFSHLITTKYDDLRRATKAHKKLSLSQLQQVYTNAYAVVLDPIVDVIKDYLPLKTWEDISPQFFVTFWSLTLYDLFVPADAYTREISRIKQLSYAAGENKEFNSSKRRKEQERCCQLIDKLQDEQRRQGEHVKRVMTKLANEKESWFASRTQKSAKNEAVTAFLQLCIFPRCIFTAPDALYCAQFVTTVHLLSTPNFSTLICYDRIFCDIIYTVTSCTENEANRYGRFLNALLSTVMKWHGDKNVFEKECASFPGFVTKFRATTSSLAESNDHVNYENYRHVCHKWHYKITKCMIVCLESKDFTQIRNSLIVLKRILPSYPRVINLANAIERWVEIVRADQKDKRHDLFALATSYIGQLKAKMPSLVPEDSFHKKAATDRNSGDFKSLRAPGKDSKVVKGDVKSTKFTVEMKSSPESNQGTPEPISHVKQEDKSSKSSSKLEEVKSSKSDTKTIRIKTNDVRGYSSETNGGDRGKLGRKLESKSSTKVRDSKRRKFDEERESRESSPFSKRHTSKK